MFLFHIDVSVSFPLSIRSIKTYFKKIIRAVETSIRKSCLQPLYSKWCLTILYILPIGQEEGRDPKTEGLAPESAPQGYHTIYPLTFSSNNGQEEKKATGSDQRRHSLVPSPHSQLLVVCAWNMAPATLALGRAPKQQKQLIFQPWPSVKGPNNTPAPLGPWLSKCLDFC